MHHAAVDAQRAAARLGAQNIGVGDVQVVARDGDVEIVLQSQRHRVVDGEIQLAVLHQLVNPRVLLRFGAGRLCGL